MMFNTIFNSISVISQRPVHLSMLSSSFFKPVLHTIFFPSHWLLSHITIVKTMDSGERGMNPVAMTIINPWKEYWPSPGSNQQPSNKRAMMALDHSPESVSPQNEFYLLYY